MQKKIFIVLLVFVSTRWAFSQVTLFDDTFDFMGEWGYASGAWQIDNGILVQRDKNDHITHICRKVKQSGIMEYAFDFVYLGGLEDNYGGFGIHICIDKPEGRRSWGMNHSYLLWLTYDIPAYRQPVFYAQVYKSITPVKMDYWLMQTGTEFPLSPEILSPDFLQSTAVRGKKIHFRLVINLNTGEGKFYNPADDSAYFPIEFGVPLTGGMYIALRTNSLSVGIDNFTVTRISD